uniref:Cation channel sperm-associated protein 1 n=1 Tax=Molossus molossus TaxID=27622 RepID=A0A7J8EP28_MOLMO|nr:cation channel sperm associated 1 [Molossus molossus]
MDQPSVARKAQNEADTSDLDVFSYPSLSTPQRPGRSGVHGHQKSHHRDGSHHHDEFQDFPDNVSSHHRHTPHHGGAHRSISLALDASRGTVLSHHYNDEDFFNDEDLFYDENHRDSRRHHGRPHHQSESYHHRGSHHHGESHHPSKVFHHSGLHNESDYDSEASEHSAPHHYEAYDRSRHHHYQAPDHSTPSEHHHGARHLHYSHSDRHYGENRHGSSQVFGPHSPRSKARVSSQHSRAAAVQPSVCKVDVAGSLTRSRSTVQPHTSRSSNKVHPQVSSSKTSETLAKEARFQKHKTGRAHKKQHNVDLWEKLSQLFHGLREMLRILTESLIFDAFIFLVVCLNIIMLVAQTFTEVEIRGEWYFVAFDSIFLCIYVVEAMLKIITMGLDYFYDSWNILDFFIMVMAVLEFMLVQLNSRSFKRTIYNQSVFRIFKIFKSLRALRAIRVLRRLSFLTSLQEVTRTLVQSLPSITAILILMFTCLFLFSVVLRAMFRHSDPKHFQNIFTTIFTLFTLLTLDDWSLIYLDSRAQGAWYIIPILMIYIIIQYFIFLNLVIAVLVDNFQMALLKGLEKVKQERATQIHERLLAESLTDLCKTEPEEVMSEHSKQKHLIEKKFGTMTENCPLGWSIINRSSAPRHPSLMRSWTLHLRLEKRTSGSDPWTGTADRLQSLASCLVGGRDKSPDLLE